MDLIARPMPLPKPAELPEDYTVKKLINSHLACIEDCLEVKAAIAYGSRDNMALLKDCLRMGKALEFYGRYDGTCPVDPVILRWFLDCKSPNIQYRAVPKWLHSKVIWWIGEGAYIGSANLTDRAWFANFESGVFLTDAELEHFGLVDELTAFFSGLRRNSQPLSEEIYRAQLALFKRRAEGEGLLRKVQEEFELADSFVRGAPNPIAAVPIKDDAARYGRFAAEWNETLQHMRNIADRVSLAENRPEWIDEGVPKGVQADQFLHAYYYQCVRPGSEKNAHERFFDRHRTDPERALSEALIWWRKSDFPHLHEQRTIYDWAPTIYKLFAEDKILTLNEEEWVAAATRVHALGDHASKMPNQLLGLPNTQQDADFKTLTFARWLWSQRTASGRSPLEVLHYLIWGSGELTQRLWACCNDPAWKLPHVRVSTLGEIVGWANPLVYPPRNMRTSKGLRALGIDVDVNL